MSLSCSLPPFLKWLVTCTCFAQQILMKLEKCTIHQVVEREHFKSATRKGGMEAKLLEIIEVGVAVMNCAFYSCLIRIFLCQAFFSENPCEERRENCSSKLHNWGKGQLAKAALRMFVIKHFTQFPLLVVSHDESSLSKSFCRQHKQSTLPTKLMREINSGK